MTDRLKVRFIVVIWGARYIEEFAHVSLPSYLAAGNLPYLAAEADLEIVVMTSQDSRYVFDEEPNFYKVKSLCPVRYIYIDDLITSGNYGVTLTLAYARGIKDCGAEQTNTVCVFMNSDFVLADGSLRTLVGKLREGHRCIMAPSLRASSETTLPRLMEAVDPTDGTLTMQPREMVKLAFENLHPTVIAKTVTQGLLTCKTHNQIYWQVDDGTLLARYHLIFMLAIKPEVAMGRVNSYCDYGFVPELVPSGQFHLLNDSDDFFMLELQSASQEQHFLTGGNYNVGQIASELSVWTTREHRRFAEVDVVFRSGEVPSHFREAREEFARFFNLVRSRMSRSPMDHVDHFYWVFGTQAWAFLKFGAQANTALAPPELGEDRKLYKPKESAVAWPIVALGGARRLVVSYYQRILGRLRRMWGRKPDVSIWHHQWLDCRLLINWARQVGSRPAERNLFVADGDSDFADYFRKIPSCDVSSQLKEVFSGSPNYHRRYQLLDNASYDNLLVHTSRSNMRQTRHIIDAAKRYVRPGGTIAVYVDNTRSESDTTDFSVDLAQSAAAVLPSDWMGYQVSANFAGGRLKRWLRVVQQRLFGYLWPSSIWRLPLVLVALLLLPFVAALIALSNLWNRNNFERCPDYCSSVLLTLKRPAGADVSTAAPKWSN